MKKKIQKPFNVEEAKNGARVERRDGKPVRIICYDRVDTAYPIIALIKSHNRENCFSYDINGKLAHHEYNNEDLVIIEEVECPKFNVGDWVFATNDGEGPWLITAITDNYYTLQDTQENEASVAQITIDNKYHLWSLKDAKPGDVLISEDDKHPFIFKKFLGYAPSAYCGIDTTDSIYISDEDRPWTRDTVRPATYEERQLLFNKLEEKNYKWDTDTLTLSKIQKRWRDNEYKTISGYYTHTDSCITYSEDHSNTKENYNLFATEKQAKSALAMAQISQIMANDERFGGVVTDEEWIDKSWYSIIRINNDLKISTRFCYELLAFHTKKQADLFLEENRDLVKDYYMMN